MDVKARTDRRNVLRIVGGGILGALAARGLAAPEAHAAETWSGGVPDPFYYPLVGSWFVELFLDFTKFGLGTGYNEVTMTFLPGGGLVQSDVIGFVMPDRTQTVSPLAHMGAWTIMGPSTYRFVINEIFYYDSAQSGLDPTAGVARIGVPSATIVLDTTNNSFHSTTTDTRQWLYKTDGSLMDYRDLGTVGSVKGTRITTDFAPPSQFPI